MIDVTLADVDFKPIIDTFISTLRSQGLNNDDIQLLIVSQKGQDEFISYCDACLDLELTAATGQDCDVIKDVQADN